MGTITIDVSARLNQPPNSTGWLSLSLANASSYIFTVNNFTTETTPPYGDPEGDDFSSIKITELPEDGSLELSGSAVTIDQEVSKSDLDNSLLIYISEQTNASEYLSKIGFTISDVGSGQFTSTSQYVYLTVSAEETNQAPSLSGEGEADIFVGQTFIFTPASLTTDLDPGYVDPENDLPLRLRIVSVPVFGELRLNNNLVEDGDEIDWQDIIDGNFKYENTSLADGDTEGFEFQISDAGSEQYSS